MVFVAIAIAVANPLAIVVVARLGRRLSGASHHAIVGAAYAAPDVAATTPSLNRAIVAQYGRKPPTSRPRWARSSYGADERAHTEGRWSAGLPGAVD